MLNTREFFVVSFIVLFTGILFANHGINILIVFLLSFNVSLLLAIINYFACGNNKKTKQFIPTELSDRMHFYENQTEQEQYDIQPYEPFIVRIRGHNFFKFTKYLTKPFDKSYYSAMLQTTSYLLNKFDKFIKTAYFQHNEIVLVFPYICSFDEYTNNPTQYKHLYNGNKTDLINKLTFDASKKFSKSLITNLNKKNLDNYNTKLKNTLSEKLTFNARIVVFPKFDKNKYELVNYFIWRSQQCYKQTAKLYSEYYFTHEQLYGLKANQRIELLKQNINFSSDKIEDYKLYGTIIKKQNKSLKIYSTKFVCDENTLNMLLN
jgi:tRNA(His) 5'-end guanylyltransferase